MCHVFTKEYNNINIIRSNYTMWLPELVFDNNNNNNNNTLFHPIIY